jgi:hypothetical protein
MNPIHFSPSHFFESHFNITFPSALTSSKRRLSLRSPHQNPVRTSSIFHTCYMPRLYYSSRFYHTNNVETDHIASHYAVFTTPPLPRAL